ncbi:MAG: CoA transferase, partial [Sphingopyxis sp.]
MRPSRRPMKWAWLRRPFIRTVLPCWPTNRAPHTEVSDGTATHSLVPSPVFPLDRTPLPFPAISMAFTRRMAWERRARRMIPLLQGTRIIEVGAVVLGPYAGQLLADLGAEVIKVEPLEGDIARDAHP